MTDTNETVSVAIIGAGVGGICLALDLQARGLHNYTIFEAEDGIGGTWYQNAYPGCRCDVAALWYSHSRHLNPNWTETHPKRAELLEYWQNLATAQGVDRHVRLRHRFLSAEWDAQASEYVIVCRNGDGDEVVTRARVLVSAIGGFHAPIAPKLKGQDMYRGKIVVGARWPKDLTTDKLRGKRVAVIGNGCSGVQTVTALSEDPEIEVLSIARSPHWYMPPAKGERNSIPYSDSWRWAYSHIPGLQRAARTLLYLRMESVWPVFKLQNGWMRKRMQKQITEWMEKELPKELVPHAIPKFPIGSKRFVMEDGYFTALKRKNTTPVWGGLSGFTETGIVLDNEQVIEDVDYVVLSLGFDIESPGLDVIGSKVKISDFDYRSDMKMYHSMAVPGMPNYFMMLGPLSATGHASIVFILETQANYIAQLIGGMDTHSIRSLEPKPAATEKWYNAVSARAQNTVWSQARSYMRARGGDGKVWTHFPGFVGEIWWTNRTPEWKDFAGGEALARRQGLRRLFRRVLFAAALLLAVRQFRPEWIATAARAIVAGAATVGVPDSWVGSVSDVLASAGAAVDGAAESVKESVRALVCQ